MADDCLLVLVLELGKIVKKSVEKQNMLAWQYNAVGVSDAITMGGEGLATYPLPPLSHFPSTGLTVLTRDAVLPPVPRPNRRQHRDRDHGAAPRRQHLYPRMRQEHARCRYCGGTA